MDALLMGGLVVACAAVGVCFLRFWKATRDSFFVWFALAFWLQGAQWLYAGLTDPSSEFLPFAYVLRLLAYAMIVVAIVRKNLGARASGR
jgi:hypothetical protein